MTWPLVQHLGTHVPGSSTWAFDEYGYLWNSWWFRYSLFNLGQSPLHTGHIFYPLDTSLALQTYNLFNAAVSLPLQAFLPLPAISNLTLLLSTTLTGYGMFLLAGYLLCIAGPGRGAKEGGTGETGGAPACGSSTATLAAAFVAGLVFAFGSYRMVYAAIGHYDKWSTIWIPFYVLYLIRTIRRPAAATAVRAGILLVLAMLCEMIFGVFLFMLTLILLAFVAGKRGRAQVAGGWAALVGRLALMGLVAAILYLPLLVPILREMGRSDLPGWGDAQKLSADLFGLVTPTALHPLGGDWVDTLRQVREGTARFQDVNTVFLGWASLALAVVGAAAYRRKVAAWITGAGLFVLFCLGPLLQINGKSTFDLDGLATTVPLPFILLHYLPIVQANRAPNRFIVMLMLSLAVLAGFGAYWLLARMAQGRGATRLLAAPVFLMLASLILFEHWSVPLPLTDARMPAAYEQVAADRSDYAILQLPLGWRNSFGIQGSESTQTQFYQSYHHKRLLSGFVARVPPLNFDYFRRIPILDSLITLQSYGEVSAERRAADRSTAAELVSFYDIRTVAVAPGISGRPPYVDTRDAAVAYIEEVLPVDRVYDRDGWLLYRVEQPPPPAALAVDLGSAEPLESMALGEGWSVAEQIQGAGARWAAARDVQVFLPAQGGSAYRLTVQALPFDYPGAGPQRLTLWANGRRVDSRTLSPGWGSYSWDLPASYLRGGVNHLRLAFDRFDAPADVLPGDGAIGLTGAVAPLAVEVNSGGPEGFAYISVGGGEGLESRDGSVHRPGYNVAVIHPKTGRLLERQGFDTTPAGSDAEAAALAHFLASVPAGRIVAVAMQGDGAARLTAEAVAALGSIGAQADLRGTSGWRHAVIGVKGAQPGTALEASGPDSGWLRAAPDRRTLAAAVDLIRWEQAGP